MIITCVLLPFSSLTPSAVASSTASASTTKSAVPTTPEKKSFEDIKNDITEQLSKLPETIKQLQNNPLTEDDQKRLHDCESKLSALETVKKLAEFADQLDTKKHNDNNILTNLCSGLETFLGFNADSKGYDGSGIVYSDLDRLCDAVMGFLSGVLEGVKDDDAVKTYDRHLSPNDLSSVLTKLTKNIGSGRNGLAVSVDAVKEWLEGYEREVNKKCDDVKKPIKSLHDEIENCKKTVESLKNKNYDALSIKQLESWTASLETLTTYAGIPILKLKHIDRKLEKEMCEQTTQIMRSVDCFRINALRDREELDSLTWTVTDEIIKLQNKVMGEASIQGERCIRQLENDFKSKIQDPIEDVKSTLNDVNNRLNQWVSTAQNVVAAALKKCSAILTKVQIGAGNGKPGEWYTVTNAAQNLKDKADALLGAVTHAKEILSEKVREAMKNVEELNDGLKTDLFGVKSKVNDAINTVQNEIGKLCKVVKDGEVGRGALIEKDKKIAEVIQQIKNQMTDIKIKTLSKSNGGSENSVQHNWGELKIAINSLIRGVFKEGSSAKYGHLGGILEDVKKYARGVGERIEETVEGWVQAICEHNPHAVGYIGDYVNANKSSGKLTQQIGEELQRNFVINAIKAQIKQIVSHMQDGKPKGVGETIDDNVTEIKSFLNEVAQVVEMYVDPRMSEQLTTEVEQSILSPQKSAGDSKNYLKWTIQVTLQQLPLLIRKLGEEIGLLVRNSKLQTNVDEAIRKVKLMNQQFDISETGAGFGKQIQTTLDELKKQIKRFDAHVNKALESRRQPVTSNEGTAQAVDNSIEDVRSLLNKQLPCDVEKKIRIESTTFVKYEAHIIQSSLKAGELQGKLPAAIKEIGNKVKEILDVKDTLKESVPIEDTHLTQAFNDVTKAVEHFAKAIKTLIDSENHNTSTTAQKGIKTLMNELNIMLTMNVDELKYGLKNNLQDINTDVYKILGISSVPQPNTNNLAKIAALAGEFHNFTIKQNVDQCISDITAKVKQEVTDKIKNLKNAALTQFAKRKSAELEELRKFVHDQKNIIENIINTDSASGLKGLLKALYASHYPIPTASRHSVTEVSSQFNSYLLPIFTHISTEVSAPSSQLVADLQSRTYDLLSHLHANNRTFTFDSGFRSHLHSLTSALSTFNAATFANPHHPQLLDALKAGMRGLVKEMEKAYVSRYDGEKIKWEVMKGPKDTDELTVDAKRCAKVFMSCLPMLLNDLSKVKERCGHKGEWSDKHLHIDHEVQDARKRKNPLGTFFRDCGYNVPTSQTSKQDGELRCRHKFDGKAIYGKLVEHTIDSVPEILKHITECDSNYDDFGNKKTTEKFDIVHLLSCLFTHVGGYYRVNHYATFTASKHPSTIFDMLQWLSGLPFNPVYPDLTLNGFEDLFEEPEEADAQSIDVGIRVDDEKERSLDAYPISINVKTLFTSLRDVCHHAEETLISFLGHGHSGGIYACEFNTNSAKLTYPSDPSKCLDLLFEVISGVYNQLFFLFKQCSYTTKLGGWYDCWYGQGVGGSAWNCNTLQCPGQRGEQKADQEHQQKCNQSCDQSAECGLKSPLQSFLEDGLPGFLPHPYSKSNCKPTCSAPGHFGKVCITPMGFNDISGMASRRQQGRHIMEVLNEYCGSEHAPLSRLCGLLTCLLTRPPQTLGDMFAFYYNFLNGWKQRNYVLRATHRENAYETAVRDANFKNGDNPLDVSSMFKHVSHNSTHSTGDLFSLVSCDQQMAKDTYCGRYLQPCGQHIWTVFSEKHAGNYLSWIVYLTETFYDLLKMLYDDCNNKCGQEHSKCNRTSCAVDCKTKLSSESKPPIQDKYHDSKCGTIVTCKSTLPTFCRYGFVFDSPQSLAGEYGDDKKRTCKDFCRALYRVLSDVKEENEVLSKLKFETIPTFLWNIRSKFFWTTVALWSLSLFYLICVMVGRLDVLHIRSHLRSPSSHKITAQSLLAAAQVGRLAKISYLQP